MSSLVCKDHGSCPLMINFAVKCPKFRWTVDGGRSLNASSKMRIPKVQILLKLSRNYVDTSPRSLTLQWAWILIRGRGCQAAQIWSPATQRPGMQGGRDRTEAGGGQYILACQSNRQALPDIQVTGDPCLILNCIITGKI